MKKLAPICAAALLCACALPPSVIPQTGGNYKAVGHGSSAKQALDIALDGANSACTPQKKRPAVSDEKSEYLASLPEDMNKVVNYLGLMDGREDYRATLTFTCTD